METDNRIQLGIIGAGNIGNVHMMGFKQLSDSVNLAAVTDTYLPLAQLRAQEHEINRVHHTPDELIDDEKLDAVIIAVPNQWHAPLAIRALQAGKHVLLEKPMGINSATAKQIVEAQRESGKTLMVAHQMRWEWLPLQLKEQIDKGSLGRIYNAKAGWMRRKGIPGWGTWFTRKEEAGGGPLIDIGVHLLDLSLHLMGSPRPVSVYGTTYAEFGPKKKGIGSWGKPNWGGYYDVEDLATAMIKLDNGATLTLDVSWAVHMNTDSNSFIHLMGDGGGVSLTGETGKLLTEVFDQTVEVDLAKPESDEGQRIRMNRHFLECIQTGETPWTSAITGYRNNLIIDAIYESSRTGNEVKINWEV
ncbi:oxidoreductase [Paenibacillus swuensis]|uniref:Oxidoreductase n=1 Tax=Paenibacillus swuensis TaxID=1178515 RepID=A0A172TL51_9BACL|nr:Gfo/Idh/MocA family oxidoreductase [Paenibacillus swuensis]ANE47785.1 oxidoreductase [Paenibacillus swuensis]